MTNEAAERLRHEFGAYPRLPFEHLERTLDAALAAERRATVERIRAAVNAGEIARDEDDPEDGGDVSYVRVLAILDQEAAR